MRHSTTGFRRMDIDVGGARGEGALHLPGGRASSEGRTKSDSTEWRAPNNGSSLGFLVQLRDDSNASPYRC